MVIFILALFDCYFYGIVVGLLVQLLTRFVRNQEKDAQEVETSFGRESRSVPTDHQAQRRDIQSRRSDKSIRDYVVK